MNEDGRAKSERDGAMWSVVSREALIAGHKEDGRTVYRREAKAKLVAAASVPGASVAKVARDHGLNANQLHVWIRLAERRATQKGSSARHSVKVGAGLERAAEKRAKSARSSAKGVCEAGPKLARRATPLPALLPVALADAAADASSHASSPTRAHSARLRIEIAGASILIESEAIDRTALRAVIDCLRESCAK